MGGCLKKFRARHLDENVLVGLIEDTKLNQQVLQGWYEEFSTLFPEGVAREDGFVEVGVKICHGGDYSQPEDLVRIIFKYLAEGEDRHVTFSKLAQFIAPSIVGTIDEKIRMAFQLLSNKRDHFTYESFAAVLEAVRKMRGDQAVQASLRDVFDALSDKKPTVDLHRFRSISSELAPISHVSERRRTRADLDSLDGQN